MNSVKFFNRLVVCSVVVIPIISAIAFKLFYFDYYSLDPVLASLNGGHTKLGGAMWPMETRRFYSCHSEDGKHNYSEILGRDGSGTVLLYICDDFPDALGHPRLFGAHFLPERGHGKERWFFCDTNRMAAYINLVMNSNNHPENPGNSQLTFP
jgi:hypothetical protein